MKTDLFQSCGHCWVFHICWHIECSTFIASSFRIWKSSTGILSPPLALFVVMLSRPTWLHIPGCLALDEWSHHHDYLGHEDLFCTVLLCIFCHLFLISSASVRSLQFLSFIEPIFAWNVPLVSYFLERSLVFPILLFSSISLHWSLRKAFLPLSAILWNSAFKWVYCSFFPLPLASFFSPKLFVRALQTTILPLTFLFNGMVLIPAFYTMSWTSDHSVLGTLSTRSNLLSLFVTSTV